jgi:SAM-dependent methyltransferase
MGRWSRLVAEEFVEWLAVPHGSRWLDVGCGTGALTATIGARGSPSCIVGVDPSAGFVQYAAAHVTHPRASFLAGDARALPVRDASFDTVVSGLVLNFIPDRSAALREMGRVTQKGGAVSAYVWDYPGDMQLLRSFWDTAVELELADRSVHEGVRFDFCRPGPLQGLFADAGFVDVDTAALVVPLVFVDPEDFWSPFLSGQGPAPSWAMSLSDADRSAFRDALQARLPTGEDGSIHLTARAWGVRGSVA